MRIVYLTTHLVMTICIACILYWTFKPRKAINGQKKFAATDGWYDRTVKLVVVVVTTGYRIASDILITYLK